MHPTIVQAEGSVSQTLCFQSWNNLEVATPCIYQGSVALRLSPVRQLTFRPSSISPLSPDMDALFVISTPIIASPESETSSSSEFDETIVDMDSFGYIGWHSGCVIS